MTSRMTRSAVLALCCVLGAARTAAAADQVIFAVRHAERADAAGGQPPAGMMANDPPLSAAGTERAKRLAALLALAEVKHIFTTALMRTKQTAAPLAEAMKVTASVVPGGDTAALVAQIRGAAGNVLVVGHSNTVPELLKQLGVTQPISIGDSEYDNLFVVVRPATGEPTLVRLRY
jgi:phosphohistidine phosphatase SixA